MSLESIASRKPLITARAREWFNSKVNTRVPFQVVAAMKGGLAYSADERAINRRWWPGYLATLAAVKLDLIYRGVCGSWIEIAAVRWSGYLSRRG